MRSLSTLAGLAAATLLGSGSPLGPIVLGGERRPHVQGPGNRKARLAKMARSNRKSVDHYRAKDPYFGIKSTGRRGIAQRAAAATIAFAKSVVGKREVRRSKGEVFVSSPVFKSRKRESAFLAALASGETRNQALKLARRVPA